MLKQILVALALSCLLQCCIAQYQIYSLTDNFVEESFFDGFDFFTEDDPTHGYVNYTDRYTAERTGLIKVDNGTFFMYADTKNIATGRGRNAIRLVSKKIWNAGLFVLDLTHMPSGCGTWPAWWLTGPNWPENGEIDLLEGVNLQTADATTLHSLDGCKMSNNAQMTGTFGTTDCYVYSPTQAGNQGCSVVAGEGTYGEPLNKRGGGVFVLEWRSTFIKSWFFTHDTVPVDLKQNMPNPAAWKKPYGYFPFGSNCSPDHFKDMQMIFDLTFCGEWAGGVFAQTCASKGNCVQYVQNNPREFTEAYWAIRSSKVFSLVDASNNAGAAVPIDPALPITPTSSESSLTVCVGLLFSIFAALAF